MGTATTSSTAAAPVSDPIAAATPPAGGRRQKGRAMLRHPSRFRSVTRLGLVILALGVALLGSTLAPAPARAQPPLPISLPPITLPALPPIEIPPIQIPSLPP